MPHLDHLAMRDASRIDKGRRVLTSAGLTIMALIAASCLGDRPAAAQQRSVVDADQRVVVLPTAGMLDPAGGEWTIPLHAWIFEREENSLLRGLALAGLAELFGLPKGSQSSLQFQERARDFLVDNTSGKILELRLDGRHVLRLPTTGGNGHAETEAHLRAADLPPANGNPWVDAAVILEPGDGRRFSGSVQLIAREGPSVISDVDDTIKISHVNDRRLLLESTFFKPFEAVPGMARAYRSWEDAGAVFHYVSSSPWQLYQPLADFMAQADFPRGSFDLRPFRLKDETFFNLFASSEKTKPPIIKALLEAYPGRQFFLVGDAGECDPEIYGNIARAHPGRIGHIFIRMVPIKEDAGCANPDRPGDRRMERAFEDLPPDLWSLFDDPDELPKTIGIE